MGGDEPSKQVQVQKQVNAILARFKHSHQVRPYHDIYIYIYMWVVKDFLFTSFSL
jgi:hypothetical protein